MRFLETELSGVYLIDLEPRTDERGFFSRVFCTQEFADKGLNIDFQQFNTSFTKDKGTFRGMHYQLGASAEIKVIKCINGSLLDVVLDLRKNSPTFGKYTTAVLSDENRRMMYVPHGCAHGFLSLTDNVEMMYFVSERYNSKAERTVRWNDPRFNIELPFLPNIISEKDLSAPLFDSKWHLELQ